jgi:hypothetical protein
MTNGEGPARAFSFSWRVRLLPNRVSHDAHGSAWFGGSLTLPYPKVDIFSVANEMDHALISRPELTLGKHLAYGVTEIGYHQSFEYEKFHRLVCGVGIKREPL